MDYIHKRQNSPAQKNPFVEFACLITPTLNFTPDKPTNTFFLFSVDNLNGYSILYIFITCILEDYGWSLILIKLIQLFWPFLKPIPKPFLLK